MQAFALHRPRTIAEAVAAFDAAERGAYLAGGVTLVLLMKAGHAAPTHVIDLSRLDTLRTIEARTDRLHIGALVTHDVLATAPVVRARLPALADLAARVGDPQVRNQGTVGGAVATNDPAGDYPAALVALDAAIETDRRTLAAESFFTGRYRTALAPGEILTAISVPVPLRAAYAKLEQPASRYALVGVMAAELDGGPRLAAIGAKPWVMRLPSLEAALAAAFAPEALADATVAADGFLDDRWGSAAYRAHLVAVLARRAVAAASRAAP